MSLTTEELGLLQDEAETWMPDRCDVYRTTPVDDPYGGYGDETETMVLDSVPCTVETGAGHEQTIQMFSAERAATAFIVYVPSGTDVHVGDHLIVWTKGNEHMRVTAVMAPETHEVERMLIATSLGEHHV